jgi:hypothetical protein
MVRMFTLDVKRLLPVGHLCTALILLAIANSAFAQNTCSAAIPNDGFDDSNALQTCLTQGGDIALTPGGVYDIGTQLTLVKPNTWLHSANPRAVLRAMSTLQGKMLIGIVDGFRIYDLEFDGNRDGRVSMRDDLCNANAHGGQRPANISVGGNGFWIHHIVSKNALCGSGLGLQGSNYTVEFIEVFDGGFEQGPAYPPDVEPWADGITVLSCFGGTIRNNSLANNTDIDLVLGGGQGCIALSNTIQHTWRYGFAGFNIGYFSPGNGDHTGSQYHGNTVTSGLNLLSIGFLVGSHPWNHTLPVVNAGAIGDPNVGVGPNRVAGSVMGIVIDAADDGWWASANVVDFVQGSRGLGSCTLSSLMAVGFDNGAWAPTGDRITYHDDTGCTTY